MSANELASGMPNSVGSAELNRKASAQEEYYRLKLLQEKFAGKPFLTARSEKDEIMVEIAERITDVRESTPEWAELVAITGSENRLEQAEFLAEQAWNKRMRELVLNKYTGGNGTLDRTFENSLAKSTGFRARGLTSAGGALAGAVAEANPAGVALRKLFGLPPI